MRQGSEAFDDNGDNGDEMTSVRRVMRPGAALPTLLTSLLGFGLALAAAACAGSSGGSGSTDGDGGTAGALSKAFGSQCARCHGPTGAGSGKYPKLPGTKTSSTFIPYVRTGKGEMPPFDASQISDADLAADFAVLSRQ
jgi:mono/diheme cytochrome c family protein